MKLPSQRRAFQEQEERRVEVGKHLPALKNLVQHDGYDVGVRQWLERR